ncbi:nucleotide disphospho-sugar-binding domain-containing protein [Actinoplanes sp. NPDC049548]|uniref:nucleotide disphospho-sugar-binding domain-containing protein n=1 Tax=Actinoplanes sp. NPDC049548 TaxID=3155152 RepID=UPI00341D52D8
MRVLFAVSEWTTHYLAMVPLGWALHAAGHDVRVLCAPSQVDPVRRAGLVPVPVLDGMPVVVRNRLSYVEQARAGRWPYPWLPVHPLTGAHMRTLDDFDAGAYRRDVEPDFAARAFRGAERAVAVARSWRPDLILHDPMSLDGLLLPRLLGIPGVLSLWGAVGTHEADPDAWIVPPDDGGLFARYGIAGRPRDLVERVIDPCPDAVRPPLTASRLPMRYLPYNGPGPMQPWMLEPAGRPRVCVVWSTALTTMSGPRSNLLGDVVAGLTGLDVDVYLAATHRDIAALGELPPRVRVLPRVPLHLLLPQCSVVVHHGGAGSTMTTLDSGRPHLVLSCAAEQAAAGRRLASAGVARHLSAEAVSPGTVREAVTALLGQPAYREVAARLRTQLHARPTPAAVVDRLTELTLVR